ncbi:MAG: hypothetical protein B6I34_10475 [Anaerolineaceae bacterium 4572_32.1]|nr:MAG: hypothetical protein B6I34_10475 [Anaerolineaceae bacterium 4572_32.1]
MTSSVQGFQYGLKAYSTSALWHVIARSGAACELSKDIALPKDINVLVVVLKQDDETVLRRQLQSAAETVFAKLWDNEADEVWNEYL